MGLFERVMIVGPGLIGGSLGMALRAGGHAGHVLGVGHRQVSLDLAVEKGAVDEGTLELGGAAREADLVVLATRLGRMAEQVETILPDMKQGAVLTDVGSVKAGVCRAMEGAIKRLREGEVRFVGGHPLAGSERRGIEAARADLFQDAVCIVTPSAATDPDGSACARVRAMWETVGCRVRELSAKTHDRILAEASHVPHAVASCLVNAVSDDALDLAASGFLDTTRVASGDPWIWVDICMANREALCEGLRRVGAEAEAFAEALETGDAKAVRRLLQRAKGRRDEAVAGDRSQEEATEDEDEGAGGGS